MNSINSWLLSILLTLSFIAVQVCCDQGDQGQLCQSSNGQRYHCSGFCCPVQGCCSYSSFWYAWALLALIVLMCVCGCAGCGARRYHGGRSRYHNLMSYSSYSDEIAWNRQRRNNRRLYKRPQTDGGTVVRNNYQSFQSKPAVEPTAPSQQRAAEPPPPYAPSVPPPYSYY